MTDTRHIPILSLIPHREPFVFVDTLVGYSETEVRTEFTVRPDTLFVENGVFGEAGLVEHVAQSCAVRIGYICKVIRREPIRLGIIGAIRDFDIRFLPPVGSLLSTTITLVSEVFGMTLVDAEVRCSGGIAATCSMKISLTDTPVPEN